MAPAQGSRWSVGAYVERIDCRSTFCGVHATSNGFTTSSTGATAVGLGLGVRYRINPQWAVGASISDLHTRLTVDSVTTDAAGTRTQQTRAQFPRKIAIAASWQARRDLALAADFESTKGTYGRSEIDLTLLRLGGELQTQPWAWRAGAMVPLRIFSTQSGTLKAPFPFSPTLGLGWRTGPLKIDFALYAHAVMSMNQDRARPAADLSVSANF